MVSGNDVEDFLPDEDRGSATASPNLPVTESPQPPVTKMTLVLGLVLCIAIIWGTVMTVQYSRLKNGEFEFDREEPVVIIGGGAAGTYLAWRLASADDSVYDPAEIHLYERTDHMSGRLFSPTVGEDLCGASDEKPDASHLPRTELGGMRLRTKDKISLGIVKELGIKIGPFYMNANNEASAESGTNPMFARNVLGTRDDFNRANGNIIPFVLGPQSFLSTENSSLYTPTFDKSSESEETYHLGLSAERPKIDAAGYNPCDGASNKDVFLEPYGPNGEPFYSYSLQESGSFSSGKTGEDVTFDEASSGYAVEGFEIGAGSPDFAGVLPPESYSYVRPLDGMQAIPLSLNDAAVKLGVNSNVNQEVTKVEQIEGGDWLVTLRETKTSKCTSITNMKDNGSIVKVVRTKRVVLALTAAALKRIEFVTQSSTGHLHRIINEIASETVAFPLMKLFAAWPTRWWTEVKNLDTFSPSEKPKLVPGRSTNFTCGRFNNDINSALFSWYPGSQSRPETIMENAAACKEMGVIQLYVFPDRMPKFVSAAQIEDQIDCATNDDECDACEPGNNQTLQEIGDGAWFAPAISTRLQKLLSLDLSTLFRYNVSYASEIKYRIWSANDPVTKADGVHLWRAGIKWWERYKDALQPLGEGQTIHLIGEIFSHNQAWVEGAFETAEHLLQEVLEVAGPSWLDNEDYCKSMPFFVDRRTTKISE